MNIKTIVALACLACSFQAGAADLTAAQIAAKNVAARGGAGVLDGFFQQGKSDQAGSSRECRDRGFSRGWLAGRVK